MASPRSKSSLFKPQTSLTQPLLSADEKKLSPEAKKFQDDLVKKGDNARTLQQCLIELSELHAKKNPTLHRTSLNNLISQIEQNAAFLEVKKKYLGEKPNVVHLFLAAHRHLCDYLLPFSIDYSEEKGQVCRHDVALVQFNQLKETVHNRVSTLIQEYDSIVAHCENVGSSVTKASNGNR